MNLQYEKEKGQQLSGMISNVERYALNDGLGVRTTMFLKGCPLRCKWCSNPETQDPREEFMFFEDNCISCGACMLSCPYGALTDKAEPDWKICRGCAEREDAFACVKTCYAKSRKVSGQKQSVEDVVDAAKRDMAFYIKSGGGVTISGGEPLTQPEFLKALLKKLKENWINTAIETCGMGSVETCKEIAPYVDMVFFDLKCMSGKKHKEWTGTDNAKILENFLVMSQLARENSFELIARTPVIPGFNDTEKDIEEIALFLQKAGDGISGYELLPYHRLGRGKYRSLGRNYELEDLVSPSDELMEKLNQKASGYGIKMCRF